ncbi:hypothetical protein [Methylobacterium sp. ID0610]|uniref:hypothetical protein n=1 Tax=Methylobacterium carpenticola TaxID=3344827 RepID=UPI0036A3C665
MEFLVEEDEGRKWRWRLLGRKGETLLVSDESFGSKFAAADDAGLYARMIEGASRRMSSPPAAARRLPRPSPRRPIFIRH